MKSLGCSKGGDGGDSGESGEDGSCFGWDSLVTTGSGGQKLMRDLRIGEEVVSDQSGTLTEFVGWMELDGSNRVKFLEIQTEDGEQLTLTETHNVFYYKDGKPTPTFAKNLSPGNVLVGGSGEVSTNMRMHISGLDHRSYNICRKKLSQA